MTWRREVRRLLLPHVEHAGGCNVGPAPCTCKLYDSLVRLGLEPALPEDIVPEDVE